MSLLITLKVVKYLIELLEICVIDVFENKGRSSRDWILDNPLKCNDVRTPAQVLQDFDLALDFFLLD